IRDSLVGLALPQHIAGLREIFVAVARQAAHDHDGKELGPNPVHDGFKAVKASGLVISHPAYPYCSAALCMVQSMNRRGFGGGGAMARNLVQFQKGLSEQEFDRLY